MTRTSRETFERLYREDTDPWGLATRWYEQRKYALTVASLPQARYRSGFEPGCSIGVLSQQLAPRCDRLLAADHVVEAAAAADRRLRAFAHAHAEQRDLPEEWPDGPFDLLVLSEVAYYFDAEELAMLMQTAVHSLEAGATVVAVHWRGTTAYPLTGDATHRVIGDTPGLVPMVHHEEEELLLDVWQLARRYQGLGVAVPAPAT